jgi:hypothetical protein
MTGTKLPFIERVSCNASPYYRSSYLLLPLLRAWESAFSRA